MAEKLTRKEQSQITEQKIFEAGLRLIKEQGVSKVQTKDICRESGVAVGLFYHYFNSKQEIIVRHIDNLQARYDTFFTGLTEKNPVKKLILIFAKMAEITEETGYELFREVMVYFLYSDDPFMFSVKRPIYPLLGDITRECAERNELSRPPEDFIRLMLSFHRGLVGTWIIKRGVYSLKADVEKNLEQYLRLFFPAKYFHGK